MYRTILRIHGKQRAYQAVVQLQSSSRSTSIVVITSSESLTPLVRIRNKRVKRDSAVQPFRNLQMNSNKRKRNATDNYSKYNKRNAMGTRSDDTNDEQRWPPTEIDSERAYDDVPISWTITAEGLTEVQMETCAGTFNVGRTGVHLGSGSASVRYDGHKFIFIGTYRTSSTIRLGFPNGEVKIKWVGSDLVVDDTYMLTSESFNVWLRSSTIDLGHEAANITAYGCCVEPLTLSHHGNKYTVRFEENGTALVVPNSTYYPLHLIMLHEFVNRFTPRNWYRRDARSASSPSYVTENSPPSPRSSTNSEYTQQMVDHTTTTSDETVEFHADARD